MNRPIQAAKQRGVALFLSLIALLMLTVLGISSFHNAHIQERSAGNARLQSIAFEAAAAGASNAINFFDVNRDMAPDDLCGSLDHEGWENATDWVEVGNVGEAALKQRMYCLADTYPDAEGGRPARSQFFVLSRGEIKVGDTVVSQRDVEVRLDLGATGVPGDGCGAICLPSCDPGDEMDFPNSNSFQVSGDGGYAVTGGCDAMTQAIEDAIRDNRIGNYDGGVGTTEPGSPWHSPADTELFRAEIEAMAQTAHNTLGACQTGCYYPADRVDNGASAYGTVADPQVTYVHGDASFGGNVSGAGIMFVNGTLAWNGTPNFQGLIVTLGGSFTVDGGGLGGDHGGSVVILNHPDGGVGDFGETYFDNTGGGTALYEYDCGALQAAWDLLADYPSAQGMWSPECNDPGTIWESTPTDMVIASWRENIGWREEFFGSEE